MIREPRSPIVIQEGDDIYGMTIQVNAGIVFIIQDDDFIVGKIQLTRPKKPREAVLVTFDEYNKPTQFELVTH